MDNFKQNKSWEERQQTYVVPFFEKELNCQIKLASFNDDIENATDLIIKYKKNIFKCGMRIRNSNYSEYEDITIRSRSKFGSPTEIDKLKNTDRIIYCVVDPKTRTIIKYVVLDALATYNLLINLPFITEIQNKNAGTWFKVIPINVARTNKLITRESGYIEERNDGRI